MKNLITRDRISWCAAAAISLAACPPPTAADSRIEPVSEMQFARLEAGCFNMGHNHIVTTTLGDIPEGPRPDEYPQHQVCVDSFWIGVHEVTQAQWQQLMPADTSVDAASAQRPIANITLAQIDQFIARLNQQAGRQRYRLPTEAEWEYACRAGSHDDGGDFHSMEYREQLHQRAWFNDLQRRDPTSAAVGLKQPNAWGLYDMLGNVWEVTADHYQETAYTQTAADTGAQLSTRRTIRGASYMSEHFQVRCGARAYTLVDDPLPSIGLRLIRLAD